MWPQLLDMSRDEAKRNLRRVELEAYSSIVSALRAQGDLNKDKKKILSDLQHILSISTERHRAEVRRAVNDECLTTIADNMTGTSMSTEWLVEGRRLIPLMPRLVPQTAFTIAANAAAAAQAEKNASMPNPSATGLKDLIASIAAPSSTSMTAPVTKFTRPSSPTSNVVVLPSGMSIHIKGGLNTEEDEEVPGRANKRKRSTSMEGPITVTRTSVVTSTSQSKATSSSNTIHGISPMKITLTKSPARTPSQKVILVSNSGTSSGPSILQRSLSVPIVKTTTSTTLSGTKTSIIVPSSSTHSGSMSVVTTTASSLPVATSTTTDFTTAVSGAKPRMKTITARPKTPQGVGIVQVGGSTQNIQVHPMSTKQAIQIKQEGGMKIITKSIGGSGGKILPKPSVVVVTSGSTSVVNRALSTVHGGKVVNISTSGGKVITTTARNMPNVVTVNPKTLQLTAVKTCAGGITVSAPTKVTTASGTKANVIVVQKAHAKKLTHSPVTNRSPAPSSPFEKELVSFIQKHEHTKQQTASSRLFEKTAAAVKQAAIEAQPKVQVREEVIPTAGKSSLLAELIQAVGIGPESSPGSTPGQQSPVPSSSQEEAGLRQKVIMSGNDWIECDDAPDASAIKALLEMQSAGTQQKPSTFPAQGQDVFTLEEAAQIFTQQDAVDTKPAASTEDGLALLEAMSKELDKQSSLPATISVPQSAKSIVQQIVTPPTQPAPINQTVQSTMGQTLNIAALNVPINQSLETPDASKPLPQAPTANVADVTELTQSQLDIFSTALASAQINLDPYQFTDDDLQDLQPPKLTHVHQPHSLVSPEKPATEDGSMPSIIRIDPQAVIPPVSSTQVATKVTQSFIPLQDVVPRSGEGSVTVTHQGLSTINVVQQPSGSLSNVSVRVEPSGGNIDISQMNFEDFTSQRLTEGSTEYGEGYVGLDASTSSESSDSQARNLGKRKRKPPPAPDDNPAPSVVGGWTRAALGLLQRVARFRGANREKGEINAAAWFTRPVDPVEAPGYYQIITQPMDFGSIKRKLETTVYTDISEFHSDMDLVRENCYKYNPPGSDVRLDCDEVFSFYMAEYEKLLDRLQKPPQPASTNSPPVKKMKVDKSPGSIRVVSPNL